LKAGSRFEALALSGKSALDFFGKYIDFMGYNPPI
jgi:hypothetical protein